jgi:hypothetical protein
MAIFSSDDSFSARLAPPFNPPSLPSATAAGFFGCVRAGNVTTLWFSARRGSGFILAFLGTPPVCHRATASQDRPLGRWPPEAIPGSGPCDSQVTACSWRSAIGAARGCSSEPLSMLGRTCLPRYDTRTITAMAHQRSIQTLPNFLIASIASCSPSARPRSYSGSEPSPKVGSARIAASASPSADDRAKLGGG